MQESDRQPRPGWITGLLGLIALTVLIAVGMFYPFAEPVSQAEAANPPSRTGSSADLSRFAPDRWFLPNEELLGFVHIPAGPFVMGSDPAVDPRAFDNERWSETAAQGTVDLPEFYMGRYEVTVAQFRTFVDETGYAVDEQALAAPADHPVTAVSWTDALAYARWLERKLSESSDAPAAIRKLLEEGWRVTLPNEAEWEKAARGEDARIYPWGNMPRSDRANFAGQSTRPVGSYECSECSFGLADMSGNAWEWTRSPFQPLPYDPTDDRADLDADALWVMRGGSFADPPELVRAALRGGGDPGVRRPFIGFRLAISRY